MKKVKLTTRDFELLREIYNNCFLSFYQIHERCFLGLSKPTVYNRLSKPTQAGFIKSIRVNLVATHKNNLDIGVIYQVTNLGLSELKRFFIGSTFRDEVIYLNPSTLYHDLLLTDVHQVIKRRYLKATCVNTKILKLSRDSQCQVPDGILRLPKSNKKVAIELELTAKSIQRYRDIILNYQTSNDFEAVLYVVANNAIYEKIGGIITGSGRRFEKSEDTDKFFFCNLKEVLNKSKSFKASNGKTTLFETFEIEPCNFLENKHAI